MRRAPLAGIIGGVIVAIILGIVLSSNPSSNVAEVEDTLNKEIQQIDNPEIQKKLDDIENKVENTKSLETNYDPKREREWITSGPFQIDRSEYALGENIFLRIGGLQPTEKGQAAFLRPLNSTHYSVYITIPFDGVKPTTNQYFTPDLSAVRGICSIDDIAGEWRVVFKGTNYESIGFTVSDKIFVPGEESRYESVC